MGEDRDTLPDRVLAFANFELDIERFELRREGAAVPVQPLVFELIVYLARYRERVVTSDELAREVWKSRIISDAALARALRKARTVLGDDGQKQRILQTVHGRGLRFVANVTPVVTPSVTPTGAPTLTPSAARGLPLGAAVAQAPATSELEPGPKPEPARPSAWPVRCEPLADDTWVGRQPLLERFVQRLERASYGRGTTWLVGGEAGIGKTSLLDRCADEARSRGLAVFLGRCQDVPGAPACWPFVQICEAAFATLSSAEREELRAPLGPLLSGSTTQVTLDQPSERFRVFEAALRLLRAASRERPVLIVLDDLHFADASSLALAEWLSRETRNLPLFLLCGHRDGGARALAETLGALLHGDSELVSLTGLSLDEVSSWLEARLGRAPSSTLLRELHARTGGNPLYLQHVWPLVQGTLAGDKPGALPETLREAILAHVGVLGEHDRRVLATAAVVGESFSPALVARGAACPIEQVLPELERACQRNLLRRASVRIGHLRFAHGLVREALYEKLETDEREAIHGRLAQAWMQDGQPAKGESIALLAYHALRGPTSLRTRDGIRFGLAAIEDSFQRGAFDQSAAFCRTTLEAMAVCPEPHPNSEAVALRLASALGRAGRLEEASVAFRELTRSRLTEHTRARFAGIDTALLHDCLAHIETELPRVVKRLYEVLFQAHPETRKLFRRNPEQMQERMLVDALTAVFDHFGPCVSHLGAERFPRSLGQHAEQDVADPAVDQVVRAVALEARTERRQPVREPSRIVQVLDQDCERLRQQALLAIAEAVREQGTQVRIAREQAIVEAPREVRAARDHLRAARAQSRSGSAKAVSRLRTRGKPKQGGGLGRGARGAHTAMLVWASAAPCCISPAIAPYASAHAASSSAFHALPAASPNAASKHSPTQPYISLLTP